MGGVVLIILVIPLLLYWDLKFKLITLFSYRACRRYIDRNASGIAKRLIQVAGFATGLRLKIESALDQPLPDQVLVVSNHQSLVDIAALLVALDTLSIRFVAKRELRHFYPMVSHVLRIQRHALIDRRSDFAETMKQLRRLGLRSRHGTSPLIFAEGTRSRDGEVRQFHAGAVRRILEAHRMPILSVAVDGGYRFSRLSELASRMGHKPVFRIKLMNLYPAPAEKSETNRYIKDAYHEIKNQVDTWHREGR